MSGYVDTIQHLMTGALSCFLFSVPGALLPTYIIPKHICNIYVRNPVEAKNLEEAKYDAQMWRKTSPGGVHCDSQIGSKSYSPEPTVAQDPRFPHNFSF